MHEEFTCEECGQTGHIRLLTHRDTQPGDYCRDCGEREKCKACGEIELRQQMIKHQSNYLCRDCFEEKMRKVCTLIIQCNRWLTTEGKKMEQPEYKMLDTWLFESKEEWMKRYERKKEVSKRLQLYYVKLAGQWPMGNDQ